MKKLIDLIWGNLVTIEFFHELLVVTLMIKEFIFFQMLRFITAFTKVRNYNLS
jgi:hypothetical protein